MLSQCDHLQPHLSLNHCSCNKPLNEYKLGESKLAQPVLVHIPL